LNEDNFSWRGSLNWKPTENTLLYANVTKGYKSGTFTTVPAITTEQIVPVPQESVLAYEAGFKTSLAQNRVELSGAAFYYDYRDKQFLGIVRTVFGFQTGLTNIPEGNIKGAEVSLLLRPVAGLTVNLGGTYVDSEVTKERPPTVDPLGRVTTIVGQPFPNTPKWQFVADAQYDFPISGTVDAFIGGSATTRSSSQGAFGTVNGFTLTPYVLLDARAGVELQDGRVRIEAWARNITNKYYILGVYHGNDSTNRLAGMPATYGATVRTRF
jgi:outer membrane receptor protein involved in Fe transport